MINDYLPQRVNEGSWVTAYTLDELRCMTDIEFVLPICSLATPYAECEELGDLILPPLYHEALDDELKQAIVARIAECFPFYGKDNSKRLRVVELPPAEPAKAVAGERASILAFSVDTAVEEHGPHLPLATDTIQSYGVLQPLAAEFEQLEICRPLEYGQLTWGLPFGFSIDLTADLLTSYLTGYVNALIDWKQPQAIYVVDVHGSIAHRRAIVAGLEASHGSLWTFRWLHEPLAEFAFERGDQHAGGVETRLVEGVNPKLLDWRWWPDRVEKLASGQMPVTRALELTPDLTAFAEFVEKHALNGIIGDIRNHASLDAGEMFSRMMEVARNDVRQLLAGESCADPGEELW